MPSSLCASSGLSDSFFERTWASQRVFTKVVRPVPEAPIFIINTSIQRSKRQHTNYHQSELESLLYVLSTSAKSLKKEQEKGELIIDEVNGLANIYVCHCVYKLEMIKRKKTKERVQKSKKKKGKNKKRGDKIRILLN